MPFHDLKADPDLLVGQAFIFLTVDHICLRALTIVYRQKTL